MSIPAHRSWMYNRVYPQRRGLREEFIIGVEEFIKHACTLRQFLTEGTIRCPCIRCVRKLPLLLPDDVRLHLYRCGFKLNYWYWTEHGEVEPEESNSPNVSTFDGGETISQQDQGNINENLHRYDDMVYDANNCNREHNPEEDAIPEAQKFYDLLREYNQPLWNGCEFESALSVAVRIMSIKSDWNIPHDGVDEVLKLMSDVAPSGHNIPRNYYEARKLVSKLGLVSQKIDCCVNNCMLYYKDDVDATECKFCGAARYKIRRGKGKLVPIKRMHYLPIIPRLKRFFASMRSAPHMRWHYENRRAEGVMCHPLDGNASKHFDSKYLDFASDPRNVRFGLCADGFTPLANHQCLIHVGLSFLPHTTCLRKCV